MSAVHFCKNTHISSCFYLLETLQVKKKNFLWADNTQHVCGLSAVSPDSIVFRADAAYISCFCARGAACTITTNDSVWSGG